VSGKDVETAMAEDYYQTLGVPRNASQAEIQKAYRDLARKHHPDMNPEDRGAKKRFQAIQKAFDILNDPQKRELYDRYGSAFETIGVGGAHPGQGWGPGPNAGTEPGSRGFNPEEADFAQFFGERFGAAGIDLGELFGQGRRGTGRGRRRGTARQARGGDLTADLALPFTVAVTGGRAEIAVPRPPAGRETIAVTIPPGIEDGKKIRLRGQGEPLPGGTPGDLILTVRVQRHPYFQRKGSELIVRVPVTLAEAALGSKVDVPTPKGTVSLRVPPGTSSGTKLRVKGHGVPARTKNGQAGDLLAEIQIVLPKQLDAVAQGLVRQLDQQQKLEPRARLRW
jgi:DnaJ-class molecular chaperone